MIYMVYSKKIIYATSGSIRHNFIVAHCLDLPPES